MQGVIRKLKRRTRVTSVGLDVGRSALRAAQLRRDGDGWVVTAVGSCRRRSPDRGGDESQFTARAARWLHQLGLQGRTVVAGLSTPDVELHPIEIPASGAADDSATSPRTVRQEIARLISFDAKSAQTDHWALPPSNAMQTNGVGVAARREGITAALDICEAACLDCRRIDATPCALARFGALFRGLSPEREDVWSVLDLGSRMSRIIVCLGSTPVLARAFVYGGWNWTEKLAKSLSVSPKTAEQHKRDYGIARDIGQHPDNPSIPACGTLAEMIYNVLRADLDEMAGELERSYRYVLQCYPGRAPGPLVLVGGGAAFRGLDGLLHDRLGVDVFSPEQATPPDSRLDLSACSRDGQSVISEFAAAIGLAVPEGSNDG